MPKYSKDLTKMMQQVLAKVERELLIEQGKRERALRKSLQAEFGMTGLSANDKFYLKHCGTVASDVPKAERPKCKARCRDGHACRAIVAPGRRRCRVHGGASTGPRTAEGKAAIAESNRRRALRKAEKAAQEAPGVGAVTKAT